MPRKKKHEQPKKDGLTKADIKRVCDILRRDDNVGAESYIEQFSWLLFLRIFEGVESQLKELEEAEGRKYKPIIDAEYQWSSWAKKDWKDRSELIHFINKKLFPYLKALKGTKEKDKIAEIFRELHNKVYSPYNLLEVIEILDKIEKHHFQDTHLLSQVYEEILQEMGSTSGWAGEIYTPRPIIRLMIKIVNPKLGEAIFDPFVGSGGFLVESFKYLYENSAKDVRAWKMLQTKTLFGKEKKPLPFLIGNMNMILHHILVPNLIRTNTLDEDVHNVPESEKYPIILTNPPFGGDEEKRVGENYPIKSAATEAMALQYLIRHLKNGGRCGVVLPEGEIMFSGGAIARIRQELLEKCNVHTIVTLPKGVFTQMGAGVKTNLIFFEKTGKTKEVWYYELEGNYSRTRIITDEDLSAVYDAYKNRAKSSNSWSVPIQELVERDYNLRAINPHKRTQEHKTPKQVLENISSVIHDLQKGKEDIGKNIISTEAKELTEYKLSEILTRNKTPIILKDDTTYKRVTIQMHSRGIKLRDEKKGAKIGTKRQFLIKEGQLLISKIDARNGAYGIVPKECDGAIITGNFWAYDINTEIVKPEYFNFILRSADFLDLFEKASQGATNRRYLQEPQFLKEKIKLPSVASQEVLLKELVACSTIRTFAQKLTSLTEELEVSIANQKSDASIQVAQSAKALVPTLRMFDIQQAVALILKRFERGEMVVAKMLYLAQSIYQVPLGIQFSAQNFGPYDSAVKKAVTAGLSPRNKFFAKKGSGNTQVLSLGTNANKILKYSNSALARKMNNYLNEMMPHFSASNSNAIERLATICKIIEDTKTTDEKTIKEKLQEWKPNKFQDAEVSHTIAFIKKNNWDARLAK